VEAIANQSSTERRGLSVAAAVEAALRQDRLLFAFQPVVCAATGKVDYFECLLRMRDEEGGIVSGGEFISFVEELGWIGLIDRYVLEKTVQALAADPEVRLGFNISGMTAGDRPWLRSLTSLLRHRRDIARRLVVEITETAALGDIAESARFVDTLRHAGCRVALDDFGAGHTSLRHLQVLPVDIVKIDGSLAGKFNEQAANPDFSPPSSRSHQGLRFDHGGRMRRERRGRSAVARGRYRLSPGSLFRAADNRVHLSLRTAGPRSA